MIAWPPAKKAAKTYDTSSTVRSRDLTQENILAATTGGITLTFPTPTKEFLGQGVYVVDAAASSITLSCTGGILGGNTYTVGAYTGVYVQCIRYGTTYKWLVGGRESGAISDLSEVIADAVGAMVTGNTETGITVVYQDSDNTLDFTLAAGLGSSTDWAAWAPTLTWATTAPAALTVVGRIRRIANAVEFYYDLSSADGEGKTLNSIALSTAPTDTNAEIPLTGHMLIDTTYTNPLAYVDAETDLCIKFHAGAAFTNTKAFRLCISGRYEVAA